MSKYVWYASYGSNINENRFLSYITGTTPIGGTIKEKGCRDKSMPKEMKKIVLHYPMFFAKSSKRWEQKGVAFIESIKQPNHQTFGKMYLITKEQFCDVVKQENNIDQLEIDFEELENKGSNIILESKYYGKLLHVGDEDEKPIYTFTSPRPISQDEYHAPALSYLKVIAYGLKETFDFEEDEIIHYFLQRNEVKKEYKVETLQKIFE